MLYDTKVKASHMPFQISIQYTAKWHRAIVCVVYAQISWQMKTKVSLYIHHSSRRTLWTTEHLLQLNDGTENVSTATNKTKEALRLLAGILCGSANGKCVCFPLKHTRGFGVVLKLVSAMCWWICINSISGIVYELRSDSFNQKHLAQKFTIVVETVSCKLLWLAVQHMPLTPFSLGFQLVFGIPNQRSKQNYEPISMKPGSGQLTTKLESFAQQYYSSK